jgi:hypothetical protein
MKKFKKKIANFMELLFVYFSVKKRNICEWVKVLLRYYNNISFIKAHILFGYLYLFINPYKISKKFLMENGCENIYAYGETPLTTIETFVNECGITKEDVVFELGCGRGLNMFWLNSFVGCKVTGIEIIPLFVKKGNRLMKLLKNKDIRFYNQDILSTDLSQATVIYFYGTGFDNIFINHLACKLKELPLGTKIITVSYPITDYIDSSTFKIIKSFPSQFTWGEATVYLQKRC